MQSKIRRFRRASNVQCQSTTHRKVHVERQLWSEGLELLQARCIAGGIERVHHLPNLHIRNACTICAL